MRILLTGASSFTGFWFAKALAEAGHEVVATLLRSRAAYDGDMRAERVKRLKDLARLEDNCPFGSERFLNLIEEGFDILAHHAAQVGDYRSPDFDVLGAVASNTRNLRRILSGGRIGAMVLTSSVFAPDEGIGTMPLRAFSPYGLSKGMTNDLVAYIANETGIRLGRFVISNPFGPLEEPRFTSYLMRAWRSGAIATVSTPSYIRDNIHVDLLAAAYSRYVEEVYSGDHRISLNPSGYVGTQGDFAFRVAREMRARLGWECSLELAKQTDFPEPIMRVNTDPATLYAKGWREANSWDRMAEAYR